MSNAEIESDEIPKEGYYGCPYIRVCPYMNEENRKSVEMGKIIPQPVIAWIKEDIKDRSGDWIAYHGCEYDSLRGKCSYPVNLINQLNTLRRLEKLAEKVSEVESEVSRIPTLDYSTELLDAIGNLDKKLKEAAKVLAGD